MNASTIGYIAARRGSDRGWRLFFVGTENEVWPGLVFASAQSARKYAAARLAAEQSGRG